MAVVIETTLGDVTVDLYLDQRPVSCLNFLKLCKMKYYNFNLFHTIRSGFIAQTGDPTGEGSGGESIFGLLEGPDKRFFSGETMPKIRHTDTGLLSMVCTGEMMVGSQFFFTLGTDLDSLDGVHCVIGEVTEGHEVLRKLNEVICDESHRPYQDVRITHTVVLEDPFNDPKGLRAPSRSPSPSAERLKGGRIAPDEEINEMQGKSAAEVQEMIEEKEAKARATILEIIGDIPDADIAPPENVLFVCKLNPVTTDEDLEIIFSRFGKIVSCEVIRDKKTGDSLQYAFIEFADKKSCEEAYFKMDNVLIDDRRIHVDFSQSVSKIKWLGKGRGVKHVGDENRNNKYIEEYTSKSSNIKDKHEKYYRKEDNTKKERRRDYESRDKDKYFDRKDKHISGKSRSHRERSKSRSRIENSSDIITKKDFKERESRHSDNKNNGKNKSHSNNDPDKEKSRHRSPTSKHLPEKSERSSARGNSQSSPPASPLKDKCTSDRKKNRCKSPKPKQSPVRDEISESRDRNCFKLPKPKASPTREDTLMGERKNRHMSPTSPTDNRSYNRKRNHHERSNSSQSVPENKRRDGSEPSKNVVDIDPNEKLKNYNNHDNRNEKYTNKNRGNNHSESLRKKRKKYDDFNDDCDRKSKSKHNHVKSQTPPKEEKQKKDKTIKVKAEKALRKNKKIKKRKPSTSSDSDSSESSSSSSSDSSSSSNSDSRSKKLRRKKRKHSTSSSSSSSSSESSSSSSSSDSSSDSTSSSSGSEPSRKKRKAVKTNKKGEKAFRKK